MKRALLLAAIAALWSLPASAQTISGCGTTAIARSDLNNAGKLGTQADCFAKAKAVAAAAEQVRRERIAAITPVPTPTPSPTPAPSPVVTLDGLPPIADNFANAGALEPSVLPPESPDTVGAFRISCSPGQLLRDDPLLLPGQPGASHLHQFWGNTGANAASTYASLRTTGNTTCGAPANVPVNRTAYWMPAMLDGVGNVVHPDTIQNYYKQMPAGSAECVRIAKACLAWPNGMQMVFGYNMKTMRGGPAGDDRYMMDYQCWADDEGNPVPGVEGKFQTIYAIAKAGCGAGHRLVIQWIVPGCWDGKNVASPDFRQHVSYGTPETGGQVCPSTHPYAIIAWQGNIRFTTDANFAAGKWRLSSDDAMSQAMGVPVVAGSTLHFDVMEAWSPAIKDLWQRNCVNAHKSCSGGNLGNGTAIRTIDLATKPPRLVPLASLQP